MAVTRETKRVCLVLDRLQQLCREDDDVCGHVAESLDAFLDELRCADLFGTEGQNDPRGDMRDNEWNMECVKGVDG